MLGFGNDDLGSEFEYDSEIDKKRQKREDLAVKAQKAHKSKAQKETCDEERGKIERSKQKYMAMDAYSRHKMLINEYYLCYPGAYKDVMRRDISKDRTDADVIQQNIKFLYDDTSKTETWEQKLAKRYHDKLFKEYAICDLTYYKDNKVAMRWCTEKEVVEGKGQFICASRKCKIKENLTTWEINFGYIEDGTKKNALVKLRLCPNCAEKLNYRQKRKQVFKKPKKPKSKKSKSHEMIDIEPSTSEVKPKVESEDSEKPVMSKEKESELWSQKPIETEQEKSRDDEFQEFLEDMFL